MRREFTTPESRLNVSVTREYHFAYTTNCAQMKTREYTWDLTAWLCFLEEQNLTFEINILFVCPNSKFLTS